MCRHFPISVSFNSVVSLFLLQIWITGEDRYIYIEGTIFFAYFSFDQKLVISLDITSTLPVSFKNFKHVIITILEEFICNAKTFAIAILVFFFLLVLLAKSSFNELLPRKRENKIGPISLDTRNKVCVTNIFEDVICDACDPCNAM